MEKKCRNIGITGFESLADFAEANNVALTVPGPEAVLAEGIVDVFQSRGLKIFGPGREASKLEGSKAFAKDFMKKYGVRTAAYERFTDSAGAENYLRTVSCPIVVKADGLAAGKGVIICQTRDEALAAVRSIMIDRAFGEAGTEVVIEEYLEGPEASILSVFDGKTILPFISAKDHKKIGEGETGPNTGGMGVVAPNPYVTEDIWKDFDENVLQPTLRGLIAENLLFSGVIFFGLMLTDRGVQLLEYNIRFGDPEIQTVLPLLKTDLFTLLDAAADGKASGTKLEWRRGASCCVVLASGGYPGPYDKGFPITGLDNVDNHFFIAGGVMKDGQPVTSGGRVLNLVAAGADLEEARRKAYGDTEKCGFEGAVFRKDIGL
jgi:phosphoribosylamine--glycine ligase